MARRASRPLFAAARADHGTVRRNNLSLIMRTLQHSGARSRARLAADTGLTKATVSSLVAELVDRGLVSEGEIQREGGIGRPGQTIDLNRHHVCGIGVEVNVDYVAVLALNLRNDVLISRRLPLGVQATNDIAVTIAEHGGQTGVFDALREQKRRFGLGLCQCLATEAHRLKRGTHLAVKVAGEHGTTLGVLALGGDGNTARQRLLERAGIKLRLCLFNSF